MDNSAKEHCQKPEGKARKAQTDFSHDHPEKEKHTGMNVRFFIPACLLLAAGIGFLVFAAGHPERSFPWDIRSTHGLYSLYVDLTEQPESTEQFVPTDTEQTLRGLRFTPMIFAEDSH